MEKVLFNGKPVYAHKIANLPESQEHDFRIVSIGQLICPNPNCDSPQMRYCHGKINPTPYFAHRKRGQSCDLIEFEKDNKKKRHLQYILTEHFRGQGYNCEIEKKTLTHHYTNIFVILDDESLAIDLVRDSISAADTSSLIAQYTAAKLRTRWLVVSDHTYIYAENKTNQICRHLLNNLGGNLIVVTPNGESLVQYRIDEVHKGGTLYSEEGCITDLIIEGNDVTIRGFVDRYAAKMDEYRKEIEEAKAREKAQIQIERRNSLIGIIEKKVSALSSIEEEDSFKEKVWTEIKMLFEKSYLKTSEADLHEDEEECYEIFIKVLIDKKKKIAHEKELAAIKSKEDKVKAVQEEYDAIEKQSLDIAVRNYKAFLRKNKIENLLDQEIDSFIENALFDSDLVIKLEEISRLSRVDEIRDNYKRLLYRKREENWSYQGLKMQKCDFCGRNKPLKLIFQYGKNEACICSECATIEGLDEGEERDEFMFWALDDQGNRMHADSYTSHNGSFCPICGESVIFRGGAKNHAHFAHKRGTHCRDGWKYDMSEWHFAWQHRFPNETQEVVVADGEEKHRADVLVKGVVVEFQHSNISLEDFNSRNIFYSRLGYTVIWVFDVMDDYAQGTISIIDPPNKRYCWDRPKSIFNSISLPSNAEIYLQFRDEGNDYSLYKVSWAEENSFAHFTVADKYTVAGFVAKCMGESPKELNCLPLMKLWEKSAMYAFDDNGVAYVKNVENDNIYKITSDLNKSLQKYGKCYGYLKTPTASFFGSSKEIPANEVKKSVWIMAYKNC